MKRLKTNKISAYVDDSISKIVKNIYDVDIYTEIHNQVIYNYIQKYEHAVLHTPKLTAPLQELPRNIIWICWLQGIQNAPHLVKKCVQSIQKYSENNMCIIINQDNFSQYVSIPNYIIKKWRAKYISNTHFSDILRLALLFQYGGTWIDATVYCTDEIPNFMCSGELFFLQGSLFNKAYHTDIPNWLISSGSGNRVIGKLLYYLYEYWKHEDMAVDYFIFHIMLIRICDIDTKCQRMIRNMYYYNDSNSHYLSRIMFQKFDECRWEYVKFLSPIHKLSYKSIKGRTSHNTYYEKILKWGGE